MEEINSHIKLCKSWCDAPESPSGFSTTVCWGFPEEQVGMGRGSGFLPPQIFQGYSMGTFWMDPPYVLIGGGWTSSSSDAAGSLDDLGMGQFGGDFTLGSAQGSSDRNCGLCCCLAPSSLFGSSNGGVGEEEEDSPPCQLLVGGSGGSSSGSLKARSWLN